MDLLFINTGAADEICKRCQRSKIFTAQTAKNTADRSSCKAYALPEEDILRSFDQIGQHALSSAEAKPILFLIYRTTKSLPPQSRLWFSISKAARPKSSAKSANINYWIRDGSDHGGDFIIMPVFV
jgi:hypothetical protein